MNQIKNQCLQKITYLLYLFFVPRNNPKTKYCTNNLKESILSFLDLSTSCSIIKDEFITSRRCLSQIKALFHG